ncbi:broad-complex core protein isoforms 1/2/3/4/5 isoform X2 [Nasonia vitripennis]|uniref:Protein abrupt n=1 Tax=Nasonia vitripennis TaxID=7425 RepID=A0A7M7QGI8_NASVI|nr:broad-complex core protein isoforms 1/2/3/4/5 isoform X2 [Nasonia vitripennis]
MAASSSSSSGEQQYSLRWNDFHSSILSSFRHLRDEEDFVDVTLACDSSSFTAHKVVLSACSPYFRRLLKANPCQHPIVILRDVASSDMESLLRFMYHGEVHVGQEQLAAFLKTAQMLQVRGLADVNSGAASKLPAASGTNSGNNASAPATPRNPWQDNGRAELNDSGMSPPPEKRPRSYSPQMGNHVESKSDLQESLLGQALEGGPTIHTPSANNVQAQSTGEDSNSISDNEEDTSNNDSILNSVKTEPSELLNDSLEHHRSTFPAALLGLQGLMPGPSGIHAANQDPSYGRWQPSAGEGSGSSSCSAWLAAGNSRSEAPAAGLQQQQHQQQQQQHQPTTSQQQSQQQQQALNALSSLNPEQLTIMHQKLQNNLQSLQQQKQTSELNLMLQSCAKKKIEELALLHPFQQHQMQDVNSLQGKPKCPECGKIYSNNSNLKQHIVNVHTVQTEYISCHVCAKQFKTKQYLQIHLLSMHGIRKRKSYPVYQMQPHAQAQQHQQINVAQFAASSQQLQFPERWSSEEKQQ